MDYCALMHPRRNSRNTLLVQINRLRSDPVSLLEGSTSAVGVPGGEAAGGGPGLAPSTAQVRWLSPSCIHVQ